MVRWVSGAVLAALLLIGGTSHAENALYCTEEIVSGLVSKGDHFETTNIHNESARRYTIVFNQDFTKAVGVADFKEPFICYRGFPSKAPDIINCVHSTLASVTFMYSQANSRYVISMVTPGGWVIDRAEINSDDVRFSDRLVFGQCVGF